REKGRVKREGNPLTGKIVKDAAGEPVYEPGLLKGVKGIGWYIEEYGIAQLSFNITDTTQVSLHQLFELACERAAIRGVRVTGSELVGVVPLQLLLDTGKYFLRKQKRSIGIPDADILKIAVKSLGLDELSPFDPKKKIIEYLIDDSSASKLIDLSVKQFTYLTASESVAPGGGSVSACMGALGVALATMVANLSSHKKGWEEQWEEFSLWAEKGKTYQEELISLIDEDTRAYNRIIAAFGLPKKTEKEKSDRSMAIQEAIKYAMEVPFRVATTSYESMEVMLEMVRKGNPNSISDAGVGALAARSAVMGASLNVQINALDLKDKQFAEQMIRDVKELERKTQLLETEILAIVKDKLIQ
ncbi:MAG: cyclodeaminase/cyclohydrolase family protein, partial [Bacteroidales bacterium]|nr:cyclodeaminase/cyclohydrolase family protein [Bacteroidales bacterium]